LRKVGWSILAIIAPELVALNAWLQYRDARVLMQVVNSERGLWSQEVSQHRTDRVLAYLRWFGGKLGMLCISGVFIVDRLRMLLRHSPELQILETEQKQLRIQNILSQLYRDQLPWTMDTAFYATCGGCVFLADDSTVQTLFSQLLLVMTMDLRDHTFLLPIQEVMLQNPSKASGLAKSITCIQAFWFCSQCIARLSQNMAISLLELNTFAHCVSALFIYFFWWHKPYDVATHAYIDISALPRSSQPDEYAVSRSKNMATIMFESKTWAAVSLWRPLIMILTFFIYGAMHLLAWQYHFPTNAEGTTWRCASITTASSGLILLLAIARGNYHLRSQGYVRTSLHFLIYFFGFVVIAARSFLVVESFRALPNSPASIYEVPRFTAYLPHI
jgi:hypothetical protein